MSIQTAAQPPRAITAKATPLARERWSERAFGKDWKTAWPFILPLLILMFAIIGWPVVKAVSLVFTRTVGFQTGPFVGLQNIANLIHNPDYPASIKVTVLFTFWSVFFKYWVGLVAALVLTSNIRFRNVLTGLVLIPWIIPEVVKALAWRTLYAPQFGGLNLVLQRLHIISQGVPWLGDPHLALPSIIVVDVWGGIPFFVIVLLSGIKALDHEQYDAAAIDGANAFRRFLHITLPGLRYVTIVCCLLSSIWTFNNFGLVYLLTSGGPGTATQVYSIFAYRAISGFLYSQGTTIALSMAPFIAIAVIFLGRYMMSGGRYEEVGNVPGLFRAIGLPFRLLFRGLGRAVMAIIDAAETGILAVAAGLGRVLGRPDGTGLLGRRAAGRALLTAGSVVLAAVLVFELFPFYWMIITAFKSENQIEGGINILWPQPWTIDHFTFMWQQTDFPIWLRNTVQVAIVATAVSVVAAALGGYALVRLRWRGARSLSVIVLITYLIPGIMLLIPMYKILTELHLNNSIKALMVTYPFFILPFCTWLLMGYYRSIPEEMEEAAQIDGCSRFGAFYRVVLPLVKPALLATALFAITASWNEFLFAFALIFSDTSKTLPVGLAQMILGDIYPYGNMMAASIMMTIPVVIMYVFGQRYMIAGLTAGSVKGGG